MDKLRIAEGDITLDSPLQWDVFDQAGHLLLSKGHLIETQHQLDELVERGLFVESAHLPARPVHVVAKVEELPSVVRLLNQCNRQLEHTLFGLHLAQDAEEKIIAIAKSVTYACNLNHDLALAYVLLNREVESYAVRHSVDTAIVALLAAEVMKKQHEEVLSITAAALTMNLGMLRQQNALQSKTDHLDERELELIRRHPEESVRLLREAGVADERWLSCVLHHHEKEDGSGYPHGKKGEEYPQNAKIVSLSDLYCAGVTSRKYRKALVPGAALRKLFIDNRKTVDAQLAPVFIQELGVYPPGSFVKLHNGETAVVSRKGKTPTTPTAHAFIGPRGAPLSFPIQRDTAKALYAVQGPVHPDDATLPFTMEHIWGTEGAL
jgi:HD-GYP domain-containing protein (c-di-GMP phosphodiesterase class II)